MRLKGNFPERYFTKEIGEVNDLICWVKEHDDPLRKWKIALPTSMIKPTMEWFHMVTGHPGQKRLFLTLSAKYHHDKLRYYCDRYLCTDCQKHKLDGRGYGLLPEREIRSEPFEEVAVDLIGPWKIPVRGKVFEFKALTMIDTVTALVELTRVENKTAKHIARKLSQSWLARYP